MKGISSAVDVDVGLFYPILLCDQEIFLQHRRIRRSLTDDQLLAFTDQALNAFADIEMIMVARETIDLDADQCHKALVELACWGSRTYRGLFDQDAREILRVYMPDTAPNQPRRRPTFISEEVPFPWELLYDGEHYQDGDPNMFWGLRMAPARVLDKDRDNFIKHVREQTLPSDMLFCLHHRLREAHDTEWPEIEKIVRTTAEDQFCLLRESASFPIEGELKVKDGETLLRYIDGSTHNMVHFACHCRQLAAGNDALEVSLIAHDVVDNPRLITLETYNFTDTDGGAFFRRPLVFLNACQAAGGPDSLRKVFNLPRKFVERGAGAVVATVCPIPDYFAAAFARQFYRLFLGHPGMRIGEALRMTRWHFLQQHNNPLGLAYGLYSPAHYRVAEAPAAMEETL